MPFLSRIRPSASVTLTSVGGAEEKGYEHLPPLDESVAAHLCPPTASGWKARATHPSEPCRATSALTGCAYLVAGQAASALHSMAVLQVFQAKMLASEEAVLDSASLRDLRSETDLALRATKATAQAIGHLMSSLIVLEHHLWLMMTEMKEADNVPFLDAPVSSGSLFGLAVEGFAERFTEAQKSSKAMQHFLPKHTSSSSTSSHPKPAPTPQTTKPSPTTPEPRLPEGQQNRGSSHSAQIYNEAPRTPAQDRLGSGASEVFLISQAERGGARVSLPLDHPANSLSATSRNAGCQSEFLMSSSIVPRCPTAVIADKIKHLFKKRANFLFCPYAASLQNRFNPSSRGPRPGRPSPVCQRG